jgi:hypothetical protein
MVEEGICCDLLFIVSCLYYQWHFFLTNYKHISRKCAVIHSITLNEQKWFGYIESSLISLILVSGSMSGLVVFLLPGCLERQKWKSSKNERDPSLFTSKLLKNFQNILKNNLGAERQPILTYSQKPRLGFLPYVVW